MGKRCWTLPRVLINMKMCWARRHRWTDGDEAYDWVCGILTDVISRVTTCFDDEHTLHSISRSQPSLISSSPHNALETRVVDLHHLSAPMSTSGQQGKILQSSLAGFFLPQGAAAVHDDDGENLQPRIGLSSTEFACYCIVPPTYSAQDRGYRDTARHSSPVVRVVTRARVPVTPRLALSP